MAKLVLLRKAAAEIRRLASLAEGDRYTGNALADEIDEAVNDDEKAEAAARAVPQPHVPKNPERVRVIQERLRGEMRKRDKRRRRFA